MRFVDLTGKTIGKWYIKERYIHPTVKKSFFVCVCECGTQRVVKGCSLNGGKSTNCGCVKKKSMSEMFSTHGHTKGKTFTSEYHSWNAMLTR